MLLSRISKFKLVGQEFSSIELSLLFKCCRLDWTVHFIKRIHHLFNISLIHFTEKVLDTIFILYIVKHKKSLSASGHKSRNKPLVEFIHHLQIHVGRPEHVFIYKIEGSVTNELIQMSVILLTTFTTAGGTEFNFIYRVVLVTHNNKVIVPRHDQQDEGTRACIRSLSSSTSNCEV